VIVPRMRDMELPSGRFEAARRPMSARRFSRDRVVVCGGGVAAAEVVLALRDLTAARLAIDMVAPEPVVAQRAWSVAEPFGWGAGPPLDLCELARRQAVTLHQDSVAAVDPDARRVRLAGGAELPYDHLVLAHGARSVGALPGAVTFAGARDAPAITRLLDAAAGGRCGRIAFVVPPRATWPLPAYELALMTAIELRSRGVADVKLTVVTPERTPLWLFGPAAGEALVDALAARGIAVRTSANAVAVEHGAVRLASGDVVATDAAIALPLFAGVPVAGVPCDDHGFVATDAHGRVAAVDGLLAAGDATTFPVKQGGLATQQADAAAESIAAAIGAIDRPSPFRPVLRGLLLTGGAPLYLRAELSPSGEPRMTAAGARWLEGETSSRPLWWPPGKIAGRYLAPYLAEARPLGYEDRRMVDRTSSRALAPDDHDAAVALTLALADEDAARGDLRRAVEALDAAALLAGGTLPEPYPERRRRWLTGAGAGVDR
jgi:sulfide:quinone oxidoreductase